MQLNFPSGANTTIGVAFIRCDTLPALFNDPAAWLIESAGLASAELEALDAITKT
jgi:hypothetical protein